MPSYHIPDPVRAEIEYLLQQGETNTATIAGYLHRHQFAVQITHRLGIVEQAKAEYYEKQPAYEVSDTPLDDEALSSALTSDS